jgi:hypothetical protein
MISNSDIVALGGVQLNSGYEYQFAGWDYLLNTKTMTFWFINDGFGEPELIVDRVRDLDHLKQIVESLNYYE